MVGTLNNSVRKWTVFSSQLKKKKKPSFEFKPRFFHPFLLRHLDRINFWVTYIGVKHMACLYSGEATYTACEIGQPICNTFSVLFPSHQYRRLNCHHICFSPGLAYDDVTALSLCGWLFNCSRRNLRCSISYQTFKLFNCRVHGIFFHSFPVLRQLADLRSNG